MTAGFTEHAPYGNISLEQLEHDGFLSHTARVDFYGLMFVGCLTWFVKLWVLFDRSVVIFVTLPAALGTV